MSQTDTQAQAFWLKQLGDASAINDWYFSQFKKHLGDRILEIGCGVGTFTLLMGQTGAEVVGLDINGDFVASALETTKELEHITIEMADVTECTWSADFDTVVALDVIEHIEDDQNILRALHDALRPGGKAIIKVPAMPSLHGSLDEVVGHYRRYSRQSIYDAMSDAGFKDIQIKFFNSLGILGWWLNGRLLRRRTPPAGQVKMFERLLPLVRALDSVSLNSVGLSLVAVGCRPRNSSGNPE